MVPYVADLHVLLHEIPKTMKDAERLVSRGRERGEGSRQAEAQRQPPVMDEEVTGEVEMAEIFEILQDRTGGRVGRWAAFVMEEGEVKAVF
jgi:hypothetical protein